MLSLWAMSDSIWVIVYLSSLGEGMHRTFAPHSRRLRWIQAECSAAHWDICGNSQIVNLGTTCEMRILGGGMRRGVRMLCAPCPRCFIAQAPGFNGMAQADGCWESNENVDMLNNDSLRGLRIDIPSLSSCIV